MRRVNVALLAGTFSTLSIGAMARAQEPSDQAKGPPMEAAPSIADYQTQAQALSSMPPDPRHPAEIKALRTLADALEAMPGATDAVKKSSTAIRKDADKLEHSATKAVHSDTTKDALTNALDALDALQTANEPPGMADKITAAREAVAKIDPKVPFLKEKDTIDDAFVKIGDALALAGGPAVSMEEQPVSGQEEVPPPAPITVTEARKELLFGTQFSIAAGGGYASFGAKGLRDITQNGGEYGARFVLGTHTILGVELAYVGTANQLNGRMPGINSNAWIVSNAFEGNFRLATPAFRKFPMQGFAFGGAGYNRFSLTGVQGVNTSPLSGSDNTFVLPFGGGVQGNIGPHVTLDGRFTYRAQFDENIFGRDHNADQYTVSFYAGYVF